MHANRTRHTITSGVRTRPSPKEDTEAPLPFRQLLSLQRQAGNRAAAETLDRAGFIDMYRSRLVEQSADFPSSGPERPAAAESLLGQVERVAADLQINCIPDPVPALGVGPVLNAAVPSDLIHDVRALIVVAEAPLTGGLAEASPTGVDWNSRLGVPQYRTQTDNIAAPEATCNVTSVSMALERVGVGRADVVLALERRIKVRSWKRKNPKVSRLPDASELSAITLTDDDWHREVRAYLDVLNADTVGYRKVRGAAQTSTVLDAIASSYRKNAQMEDLLDLLNALTDDPTATAAADDAVKDAETIQTAKTAAEKALAKAEADLKGAIQRAVAVDPEKPSAAGKDLLETVAKARTVRDKCKAAADKLSGDLAAAKVWETTTTANPGVDIGTRYSPHPENALSGLRSAGIAIPAVTIIENKSTKKPDPADKAKQISVPAPLWAEVKARIGETLSAGGAALVSVYHRSILTAGATSFAGYRSHIISVQHLSTEGLVVDDPYGLLDETHRARRAKTGADKAKDKLDAFADPGRGRSARRNVAHGTSDWTAAAGATLNDDEKRGQTHELPDEFFVSGWNTVTLYKRS